jgi:hypothetical protein
VSADDYKPGFVRKQIDDAVSLSDFTMLINLAISLADCIDTMHAHDDTLIRSIPPVTDQQAAVINAWSEGCARAISDLPVNWVERCQQKQQRPAADLNVRYNALTFNEEKITPDGWRELAITIADTMNRMWQVNEAAMRGQISAQDWVAQMQLCADEMMARAAPFVHVTAQGEGGDELPSDDRADLNTIDAMLAKKRMH